MFSERNLSEPNSYSPWKYLRKINDNLHYNVII